MDSLSEASTDNVQEFPAKRKRGRPKGSTASAIAFNQLRKDDIQLPPIIEVRLFIKKHLREEVTKTLKWNTENIVFTCPAGTQ